MTQRYDHDAFIDDIGELIAGITEMPSICYSGAFVLDIEMPITKGAYLKIQEFLVTAVHYADPQYQYMECTALYLRDRYIQNGILERLGLDRDGYAATAWRNVFAQFDRVIFRADL